MIAISDLTPVRNNKYASLLCHSVQLSVKNDESGKKSRTFIFWKITGKNLEIRLKMLEFKRKKVNIPVNTQKMYLM